MRKNNVLCDPRGYLLCFLPSPFGRGAGGEGVSEGYALTQILLPKEKSFFLFSLRRWMEGFLWMAVGLFPMVTLAVAPDHVVTMITITPASPAENTTFTATVTVKNQGTAAANGKQVTVWANEPTARDCGAYGDQTLAVGILAAGESTTLTVTGLSAGAAGTKTFRAFVNNSCSIAEADFNNNQLLQTYTVTPPSQPDFVVSNLTLNPNAPFSNSTFTASVTVKNQGMASGNGGNLTVWTNQSLAQNCGVNGDQSVTVGTLAAGESKVFLLTLSTGTSPGGKTLRAFVDNLCAIPESVETNNQAIQPYTVTSSLADFRVTNITLTPASSSTNTTFSAIVTVKNQGTMSGNGGKLTLWANQSIAQNCSASGDQSVAVGSIAAGGSAVLTLNGLSAGGAAGNKTLRAFVDSACTLNESDESNNQLIKSYSVAGRSDLVITDVTLTPVSPKPNTTFSASVIVKNQGTASGNKEQLTVWADQATDQTCGASGDQSVLIGTLAAGASTTLTITGLFVDTVGAKKLRAFVDSPCTTPESNENNNQFVKTYTVAEPTANGIDFVPVPAGTFTMGCGWWQSNCESDESPTVNVTVNAFEIGKYEVTQAQWRRLMTSNPSYFSSCGDNCPVEQVSWVDAQRFISKLNAEGGQCTYRLPTEAEWEYACRSGGQNEKYCGGDNVDSVAWYGSNSSSKTHSVGGKAANGLGIYDMSGNVWEWTCSWYGTYSGTDKDYEKCTGNGSYRVYRGGDWYNDAVFARSASRYYGVPSLRHVALGFRLARTCP